MTALIHQADRDTQVQWLCDRALISDLLFAFARALDTKDWQAYASNFAADGTLELPWPAADGDGPAGHRGREGMADYVSKGLGQFIQTQHISSNHQIEIDGDTASSHSYCQAAHRRSHDDPSDLWILGGWYSNTYRRTDEGWKITSVKLVSVWQTDGLDTVVAAH